MAASEKIRQGLSLIAPFTVTLTRSSFSHFTHRKNCTMWLSPLQPEVTPSAEASACADKRTSGEPHPVIVQIQDLLLRLFPHLDTSEHAFQPHLSLGQFLPKDIESRKSAFKEGWGDVTFDVNEIYLISRTNFDDPFHVRHAVPLGTSP